MRSGFITDVEQQYEVYCKIAEEYGFIDLNAKKNGFRCATKSNEFNAGWIAFTGAIAAMREDQRSKVGELQKQRDSFIKAYEIEIDKSVELQKRLDAAQKLFDDWNCGGMNLFDLLDALEQALKGGSDEAK